MFAANTESVETKVKFHMNALEEQVKNENHYHSMVHHLLALKIQLELFGNPKEEMEENVLVSDFTDAAVYKKERRRPEEHKNRVKALRSSKAESLKYVLQWENLLDEHKTENVFNTVKMRTKSDKNRLDGIPEDGDLPEDVSKVMVAKRVQLFEGFKKPKRVSSTTEAFLENTYEETKIYSMLENLEEEDEDIRNSRRLSEGLLNYEVIFGQNFHKTTDEVEGAQKASSMTEDLEEENEDVTSSTIKEHTAINSNTEEDTSINSNTIATEDISLTTDEISKYAIQNSPKNDSESKNLNKSETNQVKHLPNHIDIQNGKSSESVCTKPRIVQVHYKKNISRSCLP